MNTTTSSNLGLKPQDDHAVAHLAERTFTSTATAMIGIFLLALSAGGLVNPGYGGLHLNLAHNLMHIAIGAASFIVGVAGSVASARRLSLYVGSLFIVLAVAGLMLGAPADHAVMGVHHGTDSELLRIIPGYLELGAHDHLMHIGLGALYLVSALLGWLGDDGN